MRLNIEQTQKILDRFRLHVVKEARKNLTNKQKNASKGLYNSIYGEVKAMPNSIFVEFGMNQYGAFQDKGVSGKQKKYDTPFSFKSKRPPSKPFEKWAKEKGITPRGKDGRFISYKSLGFLIARSVFNKGIKPSLFFTKPFEAAFKNLPEETIKAFALDVEDLLNKTTLLK
jgi:hypothetical protein